MMMVGLVQTPTVTESTVYVVGKSFLGTPNRPSKAGFQVIIQ